MHFVDNFQRHLNMSSRTSTIQGNFPKISFGLDGSDIIIVAAIRGQADAAHDIFPFVAMHFSISSETGSHERFGEDNFLDVMSKFVSNGLMDEVVGILD